MNVTIGSRLGPYEVVGLLGAGGMGEVFRARDTKLDREVALKLLPESFASDPDRVMRFDREAKTLAALNHPHIAHIHGIEDSGGTRALVMELVEGETLADRIARGPIPLDEVLPVARQIAEALEAAHEAGIIHRDLKPANIKVRPDGTVKVLDFGLAKVAATERPQVGARHGAPLQEPGITTPPGTEIGLILGTAAYMAPEQAKGKVVDRRADIWALGCVLYEMLTGARAFDGEDTTDILGAIVKTEPDWSRLPSTTPPRIVALVRRCLQKDPRRRQQHIGDARIEIEDVAETPLRPSVPESGAQRGPAYIPWAIAAAASAAALILAVQTSMSDSTTVAALRVDITTPPIMNFSQMSDFALSPDGRFIAFVAGSQTAPIFVRTLESGEVRQLPGTDGAEYPFWSPDSRVIGFFAAGNLMRVELAGGTPATIARSVGAGFGATWNRDGTVLFGQIGQIGRMPLMQVSSSGGAPSAVPGLAAGHIHGYPQFLPDGDRFLFATSATDGQGELRIGVLSTGVSQSLMPLSSPYVQVLPSDWVLYLREGELRAQRIDVQRVSLVGPPETLATGVPENSSGHGAFSVSAGGMMAYRTGGVSTELAWFDRAGRMLTRAAEPDAAQHVVGARLSPDGTRIALDRMVQGNRDVWVLETARGSLTRLTSDPAAEGLPVWSPDGDRLAYEILRNGAWNLYVRPASGQAAEVRLQESSKHQIPLDWSSDGRFLLYVETTRGVFSDGDLFALPMIGATRTPLPIATSAFREKDGRFSPDGHWVAYETTQSGRPEILVQPFPDATAGAVQVSVQGGSTPRWSADGRELYFMADDGTLMAVEAKATGTRFEAGVPRALFRSSALNWFGFFQFEVDRAGRFLMIVANQAPPIRLLLNWKPGETN
jgi:eukaryotic-like serine/threonine-protein kinase